VPEVTTAPGVICPLCGWNGPEFLAVGRSARPNARCGNCGSLERHRAMFLYLRDETSVFTAPTRVLHFAPEASLRRVFERAQNIEYVTTDLEMPDVSIRMSIDDLLFRDGVFDCVVCSHVLEHVPDDYAAMREITRVLRPDGFALILVPILGTSDGRTLEDPFVVTPEERERVYGQRDHVRRYGGDFAERSHKAGCNVTVVEYPREIGVEATRLYALKPDEQLFVCSARSMRAASGDELSQGRQPVEHRSDGPTRHQRRESAKALL
jgi:SAM-dependent methyltransferase